MGVGIFKKICGFLTIRTKLFKIAILNIKGGDKIKDNKKTKELLKNFKLNKFDDIELTEFDELDIELTEFDIELDELDIELKDNANKNSCIDK